MSSGFHNHPTLALAQAVFDEEGASLQRHGLLVEFGIAPREPKEVEIYFWRGRTVVDVLEFRLLAPDAAESCREELRAWLRESIADVISKSGRG